MEWAIITGAVVQFAGLILLLVDIADGRAREFGAMPPWTIVVEFLHRRWRLLTRRRHGGRTHTTSVAMRAEASSSAAAHISVRPRLDPERHVSERLAALERYVRSLSDDLSRLAGRLGDAQREAGAQIADVDQRIRDDLETADATRKAALKRSQTRQAASAGLILVGLALGTVGAVA